MNLICFGDSNTWGYDPRSYLDDRYPPQYRWPDILAKRTGWNVENWGVNGQEIPKTAVTFPENADILLIMLGTNDLLQGKNAEEISHSMKKFLKSLCISKEKIVLAAPPVLRPGEWVQNQNTISESNLLSSYYENCAAALGIRFIDTSRWDIPMTFDGVHFTEDGHMVFAGKFCNYFCV